MITIKKGTWFAEMDEEFKNDPECIAIELALDVEDALYRRMQELNLNQSDLARKIGSSPAFVSQILHGKPNLTLLTLAKLAVALDLDCKVTFEPKPQEQPKPAARKPRKPVRAKAAGVANRHARVQAQTQAPRP